MAAKKTTAKKTTTKKAAPVKKASGKQASADKTTAKKAAAKTSEKKMSALDAAAKVLSESKQPLRCQELIERMSAKGYWKSPGGKTPQATLYSAMLREIQNNGKDARFCKVERGKFTLNR